MREYGDEGEEEEEERQATTIFVLQRCVEEGGKENLCGGLEGHDYMHAGREKHVVRRGGRGVSRWVGLSFCCEELERVLRMVS